ncbi:MAG: lipid-A-disaccharide synthase [Woeseiaceae bacterium]|jgi:lipid-A-disaccharide synthase|tara:strand:- start:70137 stop:71261 length:1125 start_codon:yes stop_codon:yes gene_type:complete
MRIGLVAGEASGDSLGSGLMREILKIHPDASFEGIFGPKMEKIGGKSWATSSELSVMGIIEPIKRLPHLIWLRKRILKKWLQRPPDVFIGIDSPDFNLTLEEKLRSNGITTVHYVSPSIWAWRPNRIKKIRRCADKVLCLLPFEPDLYKKHEISAVFVGHPAANTLPYDLESSAVRDKFELPSGTIIAILPGSRSSEIENLGPIFADVAKLLIDRYEGISFVSPMSSPGIYNQFEKFLIDNNIRDHFLLVKGYSHEMIVASNIVLLASGTAALESALLCRPTIAAYKVSKLSYFILNKLIKIDSFTLPNILLDKKIIPEFIQNEASVENLNKAICEHLDNPSYKEMITDDFMLLRSKLNLDTDKLAALEVLELL